MLSKDERAVNRRKWRGEVVSHYETPRWMQVDGHCNEWGCAIALTKMVRLAGSRFIGNCLFSNL
jgi:hypothetical protein